MKIYLKFLVLIIFTTHFAYAETPIRIKENFNMGWKFKLEDDHRFCAVDFDDSDWRSLNLPHDWSVEFDFSDENSGRNAFLPGGIAWYRKNFELPKTYRGKTIEIQFDGVYKNATLWVNQTRVGIQHDGYTSFRYDITELLHTGKVNVIAVRVNNTPQPNCRWYSGSGIYRNVWLNVTEKTHVDTWGTYITTPKISEDQATVNITSTIKNMDVLKSISVVTTIYSPQGKKVAVGQVGVEVGNYRYKDIHQTLTVPSPQLWSVDSPVMYTAVTRIFEGAKVLDAYKSTFGIRSLEFKAEKGFFLNGKNVKMKGVCLHHDAASLGAAVPDEVWLRRLQTLKKTGCNAIRTAHNPHSPEFMTMCDTLGFLVMNEFVDKWDNPYRKNGAAKDPFYNVQMSDPSFSDEWQRNFEQTIRRDRNHPSVIFWSVGNENHPPGSTKQNDGLRRYASFVRSIDPTRPVISGMERGKDAKNVAKKVDEIINSSKYMDVIAMNYGEQWCKMILDKKPGKPFVSTESYRYFNSTTTKRNAYIERSPWMDVLDNEANMGLFLWPGITYLGEQKGGLGGAPVAGHFLNLAGFREAASYLYESFWSEKPMVHLEVYEQDPDKFTGSQWKLPKTSQNWNRSKGTVVNLVTKTNCETIELFLNNKKIGTQKVSDYPNSIVKWRNIKYEEGTLRAVGKIEGKVVCESAIITTGKACKVALKTDKLKVEPGDIVHVDVKLNDRNNNWVQHTNQELTFKIAGGAQIIALENGNKNDLTPFYNKKTQITNSGRALCIVKIKENSSESVTLTVKGKGLKEQKIVWKILNE